MVEPAKLSIFRNGNWSGLPSSPGVYWWYFPTTALQLFKIDDFCSIEQLNLRTVPGEGVCLYHGMANNLAERVKWHAAQKLTVNNLRSGFLSTFRLSLLALNGFDYALGSEHIDRFFDELSISWQTAETRGEASILERVELEGAYHYPLNIAGNGRAELRSYIRYLKSVRSGYKKIHLS